MTVAAKPSGALVASEKRMTIPASPAPAPAHDETVPAHPRVSDALARSILESLLDAKDALGIALVRSTDWTYVMTSETYERLLGSSAILGRNLSETVPEAIISLPMLEAAVTAGRAVRPPVTLERTATIDPSPASTKHVSFTFLPVRRVTPDADGVLVIALDVSAEVHERRLGELFVALASDMSVDRDESASIRSSVAQASVSLQADAASIFLLSPDRRRLHGALVGWDWTRTSFGADVENWPNVARAIEANEPCFVTAASAQGAEEQWFERRGIKAAICAPMTADDRVVGVLFFDYLAADAGRIDLALAKRIANQCALLVERAAKRRL